MDESNKPMPPPGKGYPAGTKRVTPQQKKLVRALVASPTVATYEEAGKAAGYSGRDVAKVVTQVLKRPHVQREIDRVLAEVFPEHDSLFVQRLKEALSMPFARFKGDDGMTLKEFTDLAKVYAALKGHNAPATSQRLVATTKVNLPGSRESDE